MANDYPCPPGTEPPRGKPAGFVEIDGVKTPLYRIGKKEKRAPIDDQADAVNMAFQNLRFSCEIDAEKMRRLMQKMQILTGSL